MTVAPFVHLHVHSHYSLLDGAITVDGLVGEAARLGMPALALTDHGNLFGAIEFYTKAKAAGINPILGCEAYLVPGDATADPPAQDKVQRFHITLLATSAEGWSNLSRLSSLSWLKGFHRKPCLDKHMLARHSRGLVALSGCLSGEVARHLQANDLAGAVRRAEEYVEIFGRDNFLLEVMSTGLEAQRLVAEAMPQVARATGCRLVATNDVHYRCQGDAKAQDALICIGTGQRMHDEQRRYRIHTDQLYFRSGEEMAALFGAESEAYRSTNELASRCAIDLDLDTMHLPRFLIPTGEPPASFLRRLCEEGLRTRYGEPGPEVQKRFEAEIAVVERMGFVSYFLIVWDLIRYAKERGIPVGPGRGSAAGSIVAYALGITQLDPLRYGLLFERFLNADRISMPDIDIDFCRDRREEVIAYARQKYGESQVCQIVTFGTIAAKAAIRDAGRVLDIPLAEVDRIAKRIPDQQQRISLEQVLAADKELAEMLAGDARLAELKEVSQRIEGMARNMSTHAAGVVITDRPLLDLVPLCVVQGQVNTQFQMNDLERIGLLKMDFLGLKNLTVLEKARRLVREGRRVEIDYDTLPLDDAPTYALLKRGDVSGVFQLESSGMRDLIVRLQPDTFEDIIALIALYRPGPLQSGMVDSFVNRKHGVERVEHLHPAMEPVLKDTYGTIVYQEQVMLLAQRLGGLSLNDADGLRKAMGKKKKDVMAKYEQRFLEGCRANGIRPGTAQKIWSDMSRFAEYGFNKSHSAAYGLITFRTAYMKAHYPGESLAALMSCDAGNSDKLAEFAEECRRSGRPLLPPDLDRSGEDFRLEGEAVRFGLSAVKGVGGRAVAALLEGRRAAGGSFRSLGELLDHVDGKVLNRAAFDALVKAGAFDVIEPNRNALLASSDRLLRDAVKAQADRASGQASLFGAAASHAASVLLDAVRAPTDRELLAMEREALGFPLTIDPLGEHRPLLRLLATHQLAELCEVADRTEVLVGGVVGGLRTTTSSKGKWAGKPMGLFRLAGLGGGVPAVAFPRAYERFRAQLQDDRVLLVRATVDTSRDEPSLLVEEVFDLADPALLGNRRLLLDLRAAGEEGELDRRLAALRDLLRARPGPTETWLSVEQSPGERATFRLGAESSVCVSATLVAELEGLLGAGTVHLR